MRCALRDKSRSKTLKQNQGWGSCWNMVVPGSANFSTAHAHSSRSHLACVAKCHCISALSCGVHPLGCCSQCHNTHMVQFRLCCPLQDSEPITALAVSPDCRSLVAASRSLAVKLWDWSSGECRRTWKVSNGSWHSNSSCVAAVILQAAEPVARCVQLTWGRGSRDRQSAASQQQQPESNTSAQHSKSKTISTPWLWCRTADVQQLHKSAAACLQLLARILHWHLAYSVPE